MRLPFDWVTSFKPEKISGLRIGNYLSKSFPMSCFKLKYVNGLGEVNLDKDIGEQILIESGLRPSLRMLLNNITSDIGILSNSDIVPIISDISELTKRKDEKVIWFGRRIDIQSMDDLKEIKPDMLERFIQKIGFRQSPCTIDLFIFTKSALNELLKEHWLDDFYLGAPGVDMKIAEFAFKAGIAKRYDKSIKVLHPNHEHFRINFRTNIVLDPQRNRIFSKSRMAAFSGQAYSINLAYLPSSLQKNSWIRYLITVCDLRINLIRNWYQFFTSHFSIKLIRLYKTYNILCKMYILGNLMLPLPAFSGKKCFDHRQMVIARLYEIKKGFIDEKSVSNNQN